MSEVRYIKTGSFPPPVYRFEWPKPLTKDQAKIVLNQLEELLKDIENNPDEYIFNEVELAVTPYRLFECRSEICILPYNAFKGYVKDAILCFKELHPEVLK